MLLSFPDYKYAWVVPKSQRVKMCYVEQEPPSMPSDVTVAYAILEYQSSLWLSSWTTTTTMVCLSGGSAISFVSITVIDPDEELTTASNKCNGG